MSQWRARSGARKRPRGAERRGAAPSVQCMCTGRWAVPDTGGRCRDSGGPRDARRRWRQAGVSGCGGALHCAGCSIAVRDCGGSCSLCLHRCVLFPLTSLLRACLAVTLCDLSGCAMVSVECECGGIPGDASGVMACIDISLRMCLLETAMGSMQSSIEDRWKILTSMISVPVLSFFCILALLLLCTVSATVAMARRCT